MLAAIVSVVYSGIVASFITTKGFKPATFKEWTLIFFVCYLSYVAAVFMGAKAAVDLELTLVEDVTEEKTEDKTEDKTDEEK